MRFFGRWKELYCGYSDQGKRPVSVRFWVRQASPIVIGEMRACGRRSQRLDALWLLWKISRRCGDAICRCPQAGPRNSKISSGTSSEGGIINAVLLAMEAGLRQHFHGGLRPGLQCAFRSRRRYIRKGKTGHPVFFLGGDTGARMMASAMMETPEHSTMYYIYVRRKDEGRANYLLYRR